MKNHLKEYKDHLEATIGEYMERPVSERSADAVDGMTKCWMHLNEAEQMLAGSMAYGAEFTHEDANKWAEKMVNEDGTMGAHWTVEQTSAVAAANGVMFTHITDWCFWITMNMMYSDYGGVAMKHGVDTAEFYADLAKAFLFDKDGPGPEAKLGAYYHGIVCTGEY